jgi:hypothetical protein
LLSTPSTSDIPIVFVFFQKKLYYWVLAETYHCRLGL